MGSCSTQQGTRTTYLEVQLLQHSGQQHAELVSRDAIGDGCHLYESIVQQGTQEEEKKKTRRHQGEL